LLACIVGVIDNALSNPAVGPSNATVGTATASTYQTAPTASTNTATLPFEVFEENDVSACSGGKRLAVRVEVHVLPVTHDQVAAVANRVVDGLEGQGWQAVSVAIMYDRREATPSFAVFKWAPGGRWEDAAKGDGVAWQGYLMHVAVEQSKVNHPRECTIPSEQAYIFEAQLNGLIGASPDTAEDEQIAKIAEEQRLSITRTTALITSVEDWTMC
jgi:hypothetical protein